MTASTDGSPSVSTGETHSSPTDLQSLPVADLIQRIVELEAKLKKQAAELSALAAQSGSRASSPGRKKRAPSKPFDSSQHTTRHIALKFSYLGHNYNGYEHANGSVPPAPTIEEVLWKALRKARLINPEVAEGADMSYEVVTGKTARKETYYVPGKSTAADREGKVRLDLNWDGCQYSKCGRTDRGVSAFGQVIGVRVRSNRPLQTMQDQEHMQEEQTAATSGVDLDEEMSDMPTINVDDLAEESSFAPAFDSIRDELPYIAILNSLLPPDIRILAWCPDPPADFDARFSCRERRYKYFFTNPAFCPTPGPLGLQFADGKTAPVREGWLDIDKMRAAAKKLEGLHDFRNFCKIDPSKQMPSCERRITLADVEMFNDGTEHMTRHPELTAHSDTSLVDAALASAGVSTKQGPQVYTFSVHGTAFLWHQVRCMVAVIFLVGQGLEKPEIVDELLDIIRNPGRPQYEMADDAPLILWDCVFSEDSADTEGGLKWVYAGDAATVSSSSTKGDGKFGLGGVVDEVWTQWQDAKIREAQIGGLMGLALQQGDETTLQRGGFRDPKAVKFRSQKLFDGRSTARLVGDYISVMQKPKKETLEVLNAKYMAGKQTRRDARRELSAGDSGE